MTTEISVPVPGSVRALIAELAQVEGAVRRARTYVAPAGPVLNPELFTMYRREAEIVAALRRVTHTTR